MYHKILKTQNLIKKIFSKKIIIIKKRVAGRVCHDYYMIIYMIRVTPSAHATAGKFIWPRLEHEAGVSAGEHRRTERVTKVIILFD